MAYESVVKIDDLQLWTGKKRVVLCWLYLRHEIGVFVNRIIFYLC